MGPPIAKHHSGLLFMSITTIIVVKKPVFPVHFWFAIVLDTLSGTSSTQSNGKRNCRYVSEFLDLVVSTLMYFPLLRHLITVQ